MNTIDTNNYGNENIIGNTVTNGDFVNHQINIRENTVLRIDEMMNLEELAAEANHSENILHKTVSSRIKRGVAEVIVGIIVGIVPTAVKIPLDKSSISLDIIIQTVFEQFIAENWVFIILLLVSAILVSLGFTTLSKPTEDEKRQRERIDIARKRATDLGYGRKEWKRARRNEKVSRVSTELV